MKNNMRSAYKTLLRKELLLLVVFFLNSCASYTPPKDAATARITVASNSAQGYVKFRLCEDSNCQKSYRIGPVRGSGFPIESCSGCAPNSREFELEAGKKFYIRAETELTTYRLEDLPIKKVEDLLTDLAGASKHAKGKKITCTTTIAIVTERNRTYSIEHSASKDNEKCTAKLI